MAIMEMLFNDMNVGHHGGDEWNDTIEDDDDFGDHFVFETEFVGLSDNEFDDFGYDYGWD